MVLAPIILLIFKCFDECIIFLRIHLFRWLVLPGPLVIDLFLFVCRFLGRSLLGGLFLGCLLWIVGLAHLGKNIGQQYCWCSLMWLMPLRSLSNCDYELNFYLRLILGPLHSNQVMGTDPVSSDLGTRNSQSNSINPTYPYQSHD